KSRCARAPFACLWECPSRLRRWLHRLSWLRSCAREPELGTSVVPPSPSSLLVRNLVQPHNELAPYPCVSYDLRVSHTARGCDRAPVRHVTTRARPSHGFLFLRPGCLARFTIKRTCRFVDCATVVRTKAMAAW
ncbi:unnamed protein product, partial [Scytosiphon promiscuus]